MKPTIAVHGGLSNPAMSEKLKAQIQEQLERASQRGYSSLKKGRSALTAAVEAIQVLENSPLFNAGKGSFPHSDGKTRTTASAMDGHSRRFAGCINVENLKNPSLLAKALLKKKDRVLAEGAKFAAKSEGLKFEKLAMAKYPARYKKKRMGTVGVVAMDSKGRLASVTSTGGRGDEEVGRVSDSATVAGNYANRKFAVSATGIGEEIVDISLASAICTGVELGLTPKKTIKKIFRRALVAKTAMGFIGLDKKGKLYARTTKGCIPLAVTNRSGTKTEILKP